MAEVCEEFIVPFTREETFSFFTRPHDVVAISDPSIGIEIIEAPEVFEPGSILKAKMIAMGLVREVTYEITRFEAPNVFVETQIEGPLKKWIHTHELEDHSEGTLVRDVVDFLPPGGIAGMLLKEDVIAEQVEAGLAFRNARLVETLKEFLS